MRWSVNAVVVGIGIVAACGGQVQKQKQECPHDFYQASCSQGDECSMTISGCGQTSEVTCSCSQGQFACPDIGIGCPPPNPPNPGQCIGVTNGGACSNEGQSCPNMNAPKCGDVVSPCTCTGGSWQCPQEKCPQCPDPKSVQAGGNCGGQGPASCPGTDSCGNPSQCFCMGPNWIWYCSSGCAEGGVIDAKAD
jgi:hypothetical protein